MRCRNLGSTLHPMQPNTAGHRVDRSLLFREVERIGIPAASLSIFVTRRWMPTIGLLTLLDCQNLESVKTFSAAFLADLCRSRISEKADHHSNLARTSSFSFFHMRDSGSSSRMLKV